MLEPTVDVNLLGADWPLTGQSCVSPPELRGGGGGIPLGVLRGARQRTYEQFSGDRVHCRYLGSGERFLLVCLLFFLTEKHLDLSLR